MPLIECPDCGQQISSLAPACPHCGRPAEGQIIDLQDRVITIEQTSKKWKGMILASIFGFIMSFWCTPKVAPVVMLASIGLFIVSVVGKWWHHG